MDSGPVLNAYDDIVRAAEQQAEPSYTNGKAGNTSNDPIDFLTDLNIREIPLLERHVPPALFPFIVDTAERMGVDPASVALAALVSCASVLTDDWHVQPKRHDTSWTEAPRLWGAIVGDPSIKKSPVIALCTRPIDALDAAARTRHTDAMRAYNKQMRAFKKDGNADADEPRYPRLERYLIESATTDALSEVLRDDDDAKQRAPAAKVLCRQNEMSEFFANMDRYSSGKGGGDRGAYLRLYDGGRYTVDRIGRGNFAMPNWSACFLGGIQPEPIQRIAKDAADDGLLQRFNYAVPGEQKPGLDRAPCPNAFQQYARLFPAMAALRPALDRFGDPSVVQFHPDAHMHRESVDAIALGMAKMPDTSRRLMSAFGKWPGMFARLSLTFHLIGIADANATGQASPNPGVISVDTAKRAAAYMIEVALPHLMRADALMYSTAQTKHAEHVAGFIIIHGQDRITARDVMRNYKALRAPEARREFLTVMEQLVAVNWLEPELPTNPVKAVHAWTVHPKVRTMFPGYAEREKARRDKAKTEIEFSKAAWKAISG